MTRTRRLAVSVAAAVALLAVACGRPAGDVVAVVAGESVTIDDLRRYLDANVAYDEGLDEAADEVKSRLFDALIDERLLVVEALARGIDVTDAELDDYVAAADAGVGLDIADEGGDDVPDEAAVGGPDAAAEARRRLLIEKLQEQILRDTNPPTMDEVRAHLDANRERFQPGSRVETRALAVPTADEAARLVREIKRRRMTFDEAVVLHREDPDQGASIAVDESALPEPVRQAFAKLKPGGVAGPHEMSGEIYLFQLVGRRAAASRGVDELLRAARQDLEARRRRDVYDRLLEDVRSRHHVRRLISRLPFPYVPDETAE